MQGNLVADVNPVQRIRRHTEGLPYHGIIEESSSISREDVDAFDEYDDVEERVEDKVFFKSSQHIHEGKLVFTQ